MIRFTLFKLITLIRLVRTFFNIVIFSSSNCTNCSDNLWKLILVVIFARLALLSACNSNNLEINS